RGGQRTPGFTIGIGGDDEHIGIIMGSLVSRVSGIGIGKAVQIALINEGNVDAAAIWTSAVSRCHVTTYKSLPLESLPTARNSLSSSSATKSPSRSSLSASVIVAWPFRLSGTSELRPMLTAPSEVNDFACVTGSSTTE